MKSDIEILALWGNYEACGDFGPVLQELLKDRQSLIYLVLYLRSGIEHFTKESDSPQVRHLIKRIDEVLK